MSKKKKKDKVEEKEKGKKTKSVKVDGLKTVKVKAAAVKKPKAAAPAITDDDIALRAYFIAQRRQESGSHGDEAGDWTEAERQLRKEASRK